MNKKNLKIVESFDDIEIYKTSAFMNKIAADAMQEEKEKNKQLGIPSAFMQNGKIYYELPDGTITDKQPWDK
jgi:2',3'-cyclic-nucleotide 2'-phosphodiesterase (5'-nucleotidase family)